MGPYKFWVKVNDIVINDVNTGEVVIIDDNCFEKATFNELNNWKGNNVYEEISNNNQKLIHAKWVSAMEGTNNQQIPKTRKGSPNCSD